MLGVLSIDEALDQARKQSLDLVEIVQNSDIPVCKILNFNKFLYDKNKKYRALKKRNKSAETKEIKLRYGIQDNDFNNKLTQAQRFINANDKVKVTLMFRGRECQHIDIGELLLQRFKKLSSTFAKVESDIKREGKQLTILLISKDA